MNTGTDLIPITVYLPEQSLVRVAAIATRRGRSAATEISSLVDRALNGRGRPGRPVAERSTIRLQPSRRPLNSLSGGDSMFMLALQDEGYGTKAIADLFWLTEEDAAAHLAQLTRNPVNPRSRKRRAQQQVP